MQRSLRSYASYETKFPMYCPAVASEFMNFGCKLPFIALENSLIRHCRLFIFHAPTSIIYNDLLMFYLRGFWQSKYNHVGISQFLPRITQHFLYPILLGMKIERDFK